MLPKAGWGNSCEFTELSCCAAAASSESEYEGTESEVDSDSEHGTNSEDEQEQRPEEGPRLTGVRLYLSTEGRSRHEQAKACVINKTKMANSEGLHGHTALLRSMLYRPTVMPVHRQLRAHGSAWPES